MKLKQFPNRIARTILKVSYILASLFLIAQPAFAVSSQRKNIEQDPFYDKNAELICGPSSTTSTASTTTGAPTGQFYMLGDSIGVGMAYAGLQGQLEAAGYTPVLLNNITGRSITSKGTGDTSGLEAVQRDAQFIRGAKTIIVELGTNPETDFATKLNDLISQIKTTNSTAKIYLVDVGVAASQATRIGAANTNKTIYAKAAELGTPVISRFKVHYPSGDPLTYANLGQPEVSFAGDGIHDDSTGYKLLNAAALSTLTSATLATPNATNPCQCPTAGTATATGGVTLTGSNDIQRAYNYLVAVGFTPWQAAGIVGNLKAESGVNPKRVQNTESPSGDRDNITVDNKTGYGIAQWTSRGRQQGLVDLARSRGMTIEGDLGLQLDYLMIELTKNYTAVYTGIKSASDVRTASSIFMLKFERPKDQSESAQAARALLGDKVLELYGNGVTGNTQTSTATTSPCTTGGAGGAAAGTAAAKIVEIAQRELATGIREPEAYDKYTFGASISWCAAFASYVLREAGVPFTGGGQGGWYLTSVQSVLDWSQANNKFSPKGSIPQPGDIAIFKTGSGAYPSHVTIVISVDQAAGTFTTIGGNESNAVRQHVHQLDASYITGFARP